jgi:hypothetical protein
LLYVEERFHKIAERTLQWTTGPKIFDGFFEEVLVDTALTNWEDLIDPIADQDKTVARFEQTIQELYHKYVGAKARDTQIEYYKTLRKPMKMNPLDHSSQMLTLARYGNKLPGNEPPLTEQQIKKCIFHSFPSKWQQQFIRSGQQVSMTILLDIIEFMSNENIFADAQDSTKPPDKKKAPGKDANRDNSFKKRKQPFSKNTPQKKRNGNRTPSNEDECPIHGGHPWSKCFDNPSGNNFKPRNQDGRRDFGGRGPGCGGPGRGVGRGRRGNTGRGNGQYNFEQQAPGQVDETNIKKLGFQGNPKQHHFNQIGQAPAWDWESNDIQKPPGT